MNGGGQDNCTSVAQPNMPPVGPYAFAEVLIALIGVVIFGFFGAKKDVFTFWVEVFGGNVARIVDSASSIDMSSRSFQASEKERKGSKAQSAGATEDEI